MQMGLLNWLGFNKPRDAPSLPDIRDNVRDSANLFVFGMTHSGERVDERTAMQIVTVYACVRLLSNTIAGLPLHLYRYSGAGEDKERATDHPLYKILYRQPNPEMSSFSFWEALMCHLLLWGNAYAQIVRDGKNGIVGLYPLLPENVEIDRDPKSGDLIYTYHAYTDEKPGEHDKDIIFQRDEILHIPGLGFKRNTLWEQTKAFLEKHRGENGLVEASAVEQYNKMAGEVQALGAEIERLEQQAALDAALSAPTSKPVTNAPGTKNTPPTNPTATDEYKSAFWDMIRNKGDQLAVRNALSVGEDTEGGYTVPDEFERRLIQALEENNIFRQMATVIKTNSGTRKIPIANDTMEAQWIDEGEEIPETDTRFGQTTLSAYKLGTMIKISNELLHDSAFDLRPLRKARRSRPKRCR